MGAWEERGAGEEERGGAGGDLPTQGQKEESGVGAGGRGETFFLFFLQSCKMLIKLEQAVI